MMIELISQIFSYLSKRFYFSALIFSIIFIILGKLFEVVFLDRITKKIRFLRNPDKKIYFGLLIIGLFTLIIGLALNVYFEYPLSWLICSSGLIGGGLLGLTPFSFINRKGKSKNKSARY